ncbi:LADA_0F07976g1_1 [Lachancea dasiensis]|uniref:DNA repair protein REV1 n=1 Tax=Lachancea dasiensis TaxID=1072105 RepID=A0A1G4JKR3_9SACH|nr:LADA_0F07976g1_1 [Lachancea dasiensis]
MNEDELAELLSSSETNPSSFPHTPRRQAASPEAVGSPDNGALHTQESPLSHYSTLNDTTALVHTQQQRILSTLDDDSLLQLVNSFHRPVERQPILGDEPDSGVGWAGGADPALSTASSPQSPEDADSGPAVSPPPNTDYASYGEYFAHKKNQQQHRDAYVKRLYQDTLNNGQEFSPIFKDCIIYVNGRTDPDRLQLHQKIILHGGQFMHFLSGKTSVTHIVASNLTSKKKLEFAKYKVVTPAWIVDSIAADKRLPWQKYALITGDEAQPKLTLNNGNPQRKDSPPSDSAATFTLDCKHPSFLESFFAKSRLHHLSTWKADLRAHFSDKFVEHGKLQRVSEDDNVAIFHVDFDCFFATVSALSNNCYNLHKDALAVAHGTSTSEIASCNYVARSFGVKNGMWVRSARRLCPQLICIPYNFEQYEINSKLLYQILDETSSFDMILPLSIDEAICVKKLHSSPHFDEVQTECEQIASSIRQRVLEVTGGCTVSIGCGASLVCARLALKSAKPDGQCIVMNMTDQSQIDDFLSGVHLKDLPGIGASIVDKVVRQILPEYVKVPTIGELKTHSSLQLLTSKLGVRTGRKVHLFLSGKDDEESCRILRNPIDFFARKSISVDINYAIRFDTIHEIDDFISRVCDHLCSKIMDLGLVTPQVTLKILRRCAHAPIEPAKYLGCGECDSFSRSSRFGLPTDQVGLIATEIKSSFRMLACPPADLRGLAIQLNQLEKKAIQINQQRLPFGGLSTIPKPVLKPDSFNSLPPILKEDVRAELSKRRIEVPQSPAGKRKISSPVKEYWDRFHGKQQGTGEQKLPSSLDEDFMSHLPSQIQREIRRDHAIVKKTRSSVRKNLVHKEEIVETRKPWLETRSTLNEIDTFQTLTRPREVCTLIGAWIDQTVSIGPHKDDLDLFDNYLKKLASKNRTHQVLLIAKLMSSRLEYHSTFAPSNQRGRQEWEEYLLRRMTAILNSSTKYPRVFDI